MSMPKRLSLLLLSISLFFTSACSDEAQLAEQCETQSSCETTTETKTNWASAGGIGAGVLALGALAGGGLSGSSDGGGGSSSNNSNSSGDSNDSGATTATLLTGRLLDSAVAGVTYNTTSNQSGTTTTEGEYNYREGDQITFSIGGLQLGPINATALITPLELTGASTTADQRVLNLIRLLQTLDNDQDPSNGLFISSTFRNSLQGGSFNLEQSPSVFESETNSSLQSAGVARNLVDGKGALDHFHSTLQSEGRDNQIGDSNTLLSLLASDSNCFFDGVELLNNTSVQAYQSNSVAFGETCQAQSRTCNDGTLSGSYAYSDCKVDSLNSCKFNGETIADGDSVIAYNTSKAHYGAKEACEPQTRVCQDGLLTNSGIFPSCVVDPINAVAFKPTTAICEDVCNGLVAYYPFQGNANDASGNQLHGVVHGAKLTEDRDGNENSAYLFENGTDYISIDIPSSFALEQNSVSILFIARMEVEINWIKEYSVVTGLNIISASNQIQQYGNIHTMQFHFSSNNLDQWEINESGETNTSFWYQTNDQNDFISQINPLQYNYLIGIIDLRNDSKYLFVNTEKFSTDFNYSINQEFSKLLIGYSPDLNPDAEVLKMNLYVDELRLYDRALTESEIQQIIGL